MPTLKLVLSWLSTLVVVGVVAVLPLWLVLPVPVPLESRADASPLVAQAAALVPFFLSAFLAVGVAYVAAPGGRLAFAAGTLAVGAVVVGGTLAVAQALRPFLSGCVGALLALGLCLVRERRREGSWPSAAARRSPPPTCGTPPTR